MRRHEQNNLKFSDRVRFLQNWLYFIVCKLLKCPQWRGCKPKQCNNILQVKFPLDVENILFSVTPVCSKRFCQRRSSCQIIRSIVEIHGTDLQSFLLFSDIKYQINCQDLRLPQIKTIYSTFRWTFFFCKSLHFLAVSEQNKHEPPKLSTFVTVLINPEKHSQFETEISKTSWQILTSPQSAFTNEW